VSTKAKKAGGSRGKRSDPMMGGTTSSTRAPEHQMDSTRLTENNNFQLTVGHTETLGVGSTNTGATYPGQPQHGTVSTKEAMTRAGGGGTLTRSVHIYFRGRGQGAQKMGAPRNPWAIVQN